MSNNRNDATKAGAALKDDVPAKARVILPKIRDADSTPKPWLQAPPRPQDETDDSPPAERPLRVQRRGEQPDPPPKRFLRFSELAAAGIPFSRMHLDRIERAGEFPQRVTLGPGTVAWLRVEVEAWIEWRCAARSSEPQRTRRGGRRPKVTAPAPVEQSTSSQEVA
jgi:prophage regulatory protein